MKDLSLVPTDDLIKEIEARCETFVCSYELYDEKQKKDRFITHYGKGKWTNACALSNILNNDCVNNWNGELNKLQRIISDDDDADWWKP